MPHEPITTTTIPPPPLSVRAMLPLGLYKGFFLERRYGLATETMGHWLKDHVKAVTIGLVFAEIGALFGI